MFAIPLLSTVRELTRFASHGVKVAGTNNSIKLGKRQSVVRGGISYTDFDVSIPDIDEQKLIDLGYCYHTEHLSMASFSASPFPVKGRVHSLNLRLMVPLVCRYNRNVDSKPFNVWFLVHTGSPYTCLTAKSVETLVRKGVKHGLHSCAIQDPSTNIECRLSKNHFSEVNILGVDAIRKLKLSIDPIDWRRKTFELTQS